MSPTIFRKREYKQKYDVNLSFDNISQVYANRTSKLMFVNFSLCMEHKLRSMTIFFK